MITNPKSETKIASRWNSNSIRWRFAALSILFPVLSIVVLGCRPDERIESRRQAEQAFQSAEQRMAQHDFSRALEEWTHAIETKGLTADWLAEAYLQRAVCQAEQNRFPEAYQDLRHAARGAPPDRWHVVSSYIRARCGDAQGAQADWKQAKQLNPRAEPWR